MFRYLDLTENENGGFYTYKTPKTEMMVSTRINAQNEHAGLHMFKHSNQKWRFLYEENTNNKKDGDNRSGPRWGCLFPLYIFRFPHVQHPKTNIQVSICTELTPKSKKAVYTRIKHSNRKWRFLHVGNIQNEIHVSVLRSHRKQKWRFVHV